MTIPFILTYLASWIGISGGIYGLFNKAGENLRKEKKKKITEWLKNASRESDQSKYQEQFIDLFDRVFGNRHFTLNCFFRSSIASLLSVLIVVITSYMFYKFDIQYLKDILVLSLTINIIPDYFSLLQSRFIINKLALKQSKIPEFVFYLLDLFLTALIFVIGINSALLIDDVSHTLGLGGIMIEIDSTVLIAEVVLNKYLHIFFISTFFTSFWLWMYGISGFIIKLINKSKLGLSTFNNYFDIDTQPLSAMGFLLIILISILFLIYGVWLVVIHYIL